GDIHRASTLRGLRDQRRQCEARGGGGAGVEPDVNEHRAHEWLDCDPRGQCLCAGDHSAGLQPVPGLPQRRADSRRAGKSRLRLRGSGCGGCTVRREPGNGRYYVVQIGLVAFFVIDSGIDTGGTMVEPDGNYVGSKQFQEITAAITRSTAKWKVAVLHHSPWTSGVRYAPGQSALRWVSDLAVHRVISALSHNYERLLVRNRVHLVAGTGGQPPEGFTTPVAGSQVRIAQ